MSTHNTSPAEIHYWIHHGNLPWEWLRRLKTHHMAHHYAHPNENFGVSNTFTDVLFGTLAKSDPVKQK
jgi:sterol desaturase/sphingolipid hydroxylase (fatty acid hydroxylase superfamily)